MYCNKYGKFGVCPPPPLLILKYNLKYSSKHIYFIQYIYLTHFSYVFPNPLPFSCVCNKVPHINNVFIYLFRNNLQDTCIHSTGGEFRNYGEAMKLERKKEKRMKERMTERKKKKRKKERKNERKKERFIFFAL